MMTFYVMQFRAKAMKYIDILIYSKILHFLGQNLRKNIRIYTSTFSGRGNSRGRGRGGTPRGGSRGTGSNSIDLNSSAGTGANKKMSFDD